MNKISLVLMTVLGISLTATPQAQAGIVIGALNGDALQGMAVGALIGAGAGLGVAIVTEMDTDTDGWFPLLAAMSTGVGTVAGVFLDVDASAGSNSLVTGFRAHFPFIDNAEALSNLANVTTAKVESGISENPEASQIMVRLSREEVIDALNGVDLTSEQLDIVVDALK